MSANGEVEVAVRAEGVDDATGEFDPSAADGGDGGGDQTNIAQTATNTGKMVKTLAILGAILSVFNDLLQIVGIISSIARAFIAPLAVMLLRLFQPVLGLLFQILPAWLSFIDENEGAFKMILYALAPILFGIELLVGTLTGVYNFLKSLPGKIKQFIADVEQSVDDAVDYLQSLPGDIWEKFKQLPGMIADNIESQLPDLGALGAGAGSQPLLAGLSRLLSFGDDSDSGQGAPNISIEGGLGAFISQITDDTGIDFP